MPPPPSPATLVSAGWSVGWLVGCIAGRLAGLLAGRLVGLASLRLASPCFALRRGLCCVVMCRAAQCCAVLCCAALEKVYYIL